MQWENMNDYYYAWAVYIAGAVGCSLAAWLFFRGLPRALVHFFLVTVMVLLFTPFAIDAKTMVMAPAVICLGYGFIAEGFTSVKPVLKTLIGIWAAAMVLSLLYQLLTHRAYKAKQLARLNASEDDNNHTLEEPTKVQQRQEPVINTYQTTNADSTAEPPIRAER